MRGSVCLRAILLGAVLLAPEAMHAAVKRAFVTSTTYDGNLSALPGGGDVLAKADAECQARADAANLDGTFRAWLSTGSVDAFCHVQGLTGTKSDSCSGASDAQSSGPWVRVDGTTPFTGRLDELSDGRAVYLPVQLDETGAVVTGLAARYWTGTVSTGQRGLDTCSFWTSSTGPTPRGASGLADATSESWTYGSFPSCDQVSRLLCLEQGAGEPFTPSWTPGYVAFTTTAEGTGALGGATWPEAGGVAGIEGADATCRALAAAARLPHAESFVAWLSDADTDARDRITGTGPFVRIDGFVVAEDLADLTDGTLDAPINIDETGAYLNDDGRVWTGTTGAGTEFNHCTSWSVESGGSGTAGIAAYHDEVWTIHGSFQCSVSNRIYCIAQEPVLFWDGFEYLAGLGRWSDAQQ